MVRSPSTTTFSLFTSLPAELRCKIWAFAGLAMPAILYIDLHYDPVRALDFEIFVLPQHVIDICQARVIMAACREARTEGRRRLPDVLHTGNMGAVRVDARRNTLFFAMVVNTREGPSRLIEDFFTVMQHRVGASLFILTSAICAHPLSLFVLFWLCLQILLGGRWRHIFWPEEKTDTGRPRWNIAMDVDSVRDELLIPNNFQGFLTLLADAVGFGNLYIHCHELKKIHGTCKTCGQISDAGFWKAADPGTRFA